MEPKNEKLHFTKPELSVEELSTALYEANKRLASTNSKLLESEKLRKEMISNLSHDLRSPLSTLKGYIEYLGSFDHIDKNELVHSLELMDQKVIILEQLIDKLLTVSTLDDPNTISLHLEEIPIGIYLEDFFYSCQTDTRYSKRKLILDIPFNFDYTVLIDPNMFRRVLDNLFSNALKYSKDNDTIELQAFLKESDIVIVVKDSGIGIAPEFQKKIFERTYMISNSRTPEQTSSSCGLGLSIAESITKKHSGNIWCESAPSKGSSFYITIPWIS